MNEPLESSGESVLPKRTWWRPIRSPIMSPFGLLIVGLLLGVLFFLATLFGFREYATGLTGTLAAEGTSKEMSFFLGKLYLVLYAGALLVAPIFVLASVIMLVLSTVLRVRSTLGAKRVPDSLGAGGAKNP